MLIFRNWKFTIETGMMRGPFLASRYIKCSAVIPRKANSGDPKYLIRERM